LQAGVQQSTDGRSNRQTLFSWWEWAVAANGVEIDGGQTTIENMPAFPGDTISVYIEVIPILLPGTPIFEAVERDGFTDVGATNSSSRLTSLGWYYFANITQGLYTSFFAGTSDTLTGQGQNGGFGWWGNGAGNWIVETPSHDGSCRDPLPRYGAVIFADAACGTRMDNENLPEIPASGIIAPSGRVWTLTTSGNTVLSVIEDARGNEMSGGSLAFNNADPFQNFVTSAWTYQHG
jgi:hypothetical protein